MIQFEIFINLNIRKIIKIFEIIILKLYLDLNNNNKIIWYFNAKYNFMSDRI